MFVVTLRVLVALHEDPVWSKRALECRNDVEALRKVVVEFTQEKGFRVKDLDADLAAPEVAS
jgi:hypothetical protein